MSDLRSLTENSGAEGAVPVAARETEPILDPAAIERLIMTCGEGGEPVVAALLETFFDDVPRQLETLRRGRADGDAEKIRRAAHTIKSHGMNFGVPHMVQVAREVELLARQNDLTGAGHLLSELEAQLEQARQALEATHRALLNPTASGLAA